MECSHRWHFVSDAKALKELRFDALHARDLYGLDLQLVQTSAAMAAGTLGTVMGARNCRPPRVQ
eukprot:scaffold1266_cov92-Isochrysis_galbana.AAC.4